MRLLGVTFAVRRLELGEKETSGVYSQYPSMEHFAEMARDEQHHEEKLIEMIDEERLQYMGSVVLGLMMPWWSLPEHWQVSHWH